MTPRGGTRKGAGRKALPEDARRVMASFRLLPETIEHLQNLADVYGMSQAEMIDQLVRHEP